MERRARNLAKDDRSVGAAPGSEEKLIEFFRRQAITIFVNKVVMMNDARQRGITVTLADRQKFVAELERELRNRGVAPSLDAFFQKSPLGEKETRREFEDGLLVDKYSLEVRGKLPVTDADRDALNLELTRIRKEARAKAEELRAQLRSGADMAAMIHEAVRGKDQRIFGGDLGDVTRGRLPEKAIEDALFTQKINEIGPVLETSRGCLVLKVVSRTAAKPAAGATPAVPESARASFLTVRMPPPLPASELTRVIQDRKLQQTIKALRAKAHIETIYKDLVL
jgi:parvulin-like peptidyl-prolyl isomerase